MVQPSSAAAESLFYGFIDRQNFRRHFNDVTVQFIGFISSIITYTLSTIGNRYALYRKFERGWGSLHAIMAKQVSLQDVLSAVGGPLEEKSLWALLYQAHDALRKGIEGLST